MSSSREASSSHPSNPYNRSASDQDASRPVDGTNLDNYQFTFERPYEDAVAASIRIDADSFMGRDYDSFTSDVTTYRNENGRTYHGYKDGSYMFPNDNKELERLLLQYNLLKDVMGQKLFLAPWSQSHPPRNVLDIATGLGDWAIDMGDEFPTARICGTDLSPEFADFTPPNVRFLVDDARDPWDWDEKFDYIHTRVTLGCWRDLKEDILYKAFEALEPGGYFEAQEILSSILCDDDSMGDNHALKVHIAEIEAATASVDRPINTADQWKQAMEDVGFVDVRQVTYKIPINGWARDLTYKTWGKMWGKIWLDGLEAYSLGPLTRVRELPEIQLQVLLADVRQSIQDQSVHAYNKFFVVVGRKPYPDEKIESKPSGLSESGEDTEMADTLGD